MYLLDTDVLSNLLKPTPSIILLTKLALVSPNDQFTSSVTLGEMFFGAYRVASRTDRLIDDIQSRIMVNLEVLTFDVAAAHQYGRIKAHLQRHGTLIGDADTQIASIALSNNLIMVTGNVRHFQRIPELTVENWLE